HPVVAEMPDLGSLSVHVADLEAADLSAAAQLDEDEDALAIQLAAFLRLDPVVLPGAHEIPDARGHRAEPVPFAGFRSADHYVLDLGIRPAHRAEIGALPFREDRAHEVQVLGHRLLHLPDGSECA